MPVPEHSPSAVISGMGLREHFMSTLSDAIANQKVEADAETVLYLVNMLEHFARADRLFEQSADGITLQPLATLYAKAIQACRPDERHRALKHLGDVALLIAGLYSESLNRKLVDVDYYIAMGSSAYGCLSDDCRQSPGLRPCEARFPNWQTSFASLSMS